MKQKKRVKEGLIPADVLSPQSVHVQSSQATSSTSSLVSGTNPSPSINSMSNVSDQAVGSSENSRESN